MMQPHCTSLHHVSYIMIYDLNMLGLVMKYGILCQTCNFWANFKFPSGRVEGERFQLLWERFVIPLEDGSLTILLEELTSWNYPILSCNLFLDVIDSSTHSIPQKKYVASCNLLIVRHQGFGEDILSLQKISFKSFSSLSPTLFFIPPFMRVILTLITD